MYSRKSIRAYQPVTRYLPAEAEASEEKVTPPPDYTGMAFYDRREAVDYPETVILPTEEEQTLTKEEDTPLSEELFSLEPPADEPLSFEEEDSPVPNQTEKEPLPPTIPETTEKSAAVNQPPLLTPAWLRSLTLEDMLLFWLILLLLTGEPEDQIYLLLGLLLFAGR